MLSFHATRLAPSPTGALHLGHARTFLITWWLARQAGAKIYMRMEDIDTARAKPDSIQQAYDDLHWLGIDWNPYQETPTSPPQTQVLQSLRLPLYAAALESLWLTGHAYPCTCSRAAIAANVAASASAPHESDPQPRYPGTCRDKYPPAHPPATLAQTLAHIHASTNKPICLRLRTPNTPTPFTDLLAGPQSFNVNQSTGDFPLTRFTPPPTIPPSLPPTSPRPPCLLVSLSPCLPPPPPAYQLACVVDDHAMAIDLVIRGNDLLPSTPRQLLIYQALNLAPPQFAHVPLILGPDGTRLAKRHGESRIAQFRRAGLPPQRLVGWVAWRSGQFPRPQEISPQDLLPTFNPALLPHHPLTLLPEDLAFLRP